MKIGMNVFYQGKKYILLAVFENGFCIVRELNSVLDIKKVRISELELSQ